MCCNRGHPEGLGGFLPQTAPKLRAERWLGFARGVEAEDRRTFQGEGTMGAKAQRLEQVHLGNCNQDGNT